VWAAHTVIDNAGLAEVRGFSNVKVNVSFHFGFRLLLLTLVLNLRSGRLQLAELLGENRDNTEQADTILPYSLPQMNMRHNLHDVNPIQEETSHIKRKHAFVHAHTGGVDMRL